MIVADDNMWYNTVVSAAAAPGIIEIRNRFAMGSGYACNRIKLVAVLVTCLLFSTVFYGCGGGGGSTTVTAPQYGSIEGYVYALIGSGARVAEAVPAGKKAVQGASVTVTCGSTQKNATTNSSGYFKITSLPAGSCTVTVTYTGFGNYQTSVSVTANSTATVGGSSGIALSLASSGSIKVTANVSGGTVSIDGESTGVTIPTGLSHTFDGIAPGAHTVSITQSGYDAVTEQDVDLSVGQTVAVIFVLNPTGNQVPVADTGINKTTPVGVTIKLNGGNSADPDGDSLFYNWNQNSGPQVELSNSNASETVFIPVFPGKYEFSLIVSDGYLESEPNSVVIDVVELTGKFVFRMNTTGYVDSPDEIFSVNADGTGFSQLTNEGGASNPKWSPDGTKIAYTQVVDEMKTAIFVMNADGSQKENVSVDSTRDSLVGWSPDGSTLLFTDGFPNTGLFTMNVDGTNRQKILETNNSILTACYSTDGAEITMTLDFGSTYWEIFRVNSNGSGLVRLTNDTDSQTQPCLTNDNQNIIYTYTPDITAATLGSTCGEDPFINWTEWLLCNDILSRDQLYLMDRNGNNPKAIQAFSGINSTIRSIVVDPLYPLIYYIGYENAGTSGIKVMDINTGERYDVFTDIPHSAYNLDWYPQR